MSTSSLSSPGSSQYNGNTMYVGDGTWDSGRNDFLLPNLMGLNFATMQYNGMGNRFRDLPEYHTLIRGHAILAAITFIGIVPAAIFIAKYYKTNTRLAFKLHVYLQILTVLLTTVVIVLGWFAVGPERSLTNPHHGIGIAIYVLILAQFLLGWLMYSFERRRKTMPWKIPLKVWVHKIFGRSIATLAFVQIALGLTLYGSPKVLFILYALVGALLVFLYLALDYYYKGRATGIGASGDGPEFYSDYGSYISGSRTDMTQDRRRRESPRRESHWGRNLLAGAGALGAYEAWKHRRNKRREGDDYAEDRRAESRERIDRRDRPPVVGSRPGSRPPSQSRPPIMGENRRPLRDRSSRESWEDEKMGGRQRGRHTWRNRILGVGAGLGGYEGLKALLSRRSNRDDGGHLEEGGYRPPLGGNQNMVSRTDVSRVEAGQAPFSPGDPRRTTRVNMAEASSVPPGASSMTPTRPGRRPRPSEESYSYDSRASFDDGPTNLQSQSGSGPHTLRDSIATFGALAGFREWDRRRRDRREEQRIDRERRQEMDNAERFNRRQSGHYPRPQDAMRRRTSQTETLMTSVTPDPGFRGSNPELSGHNLRPPDTNIPPLPAAAGTIPSGSGLSGSRQNVISEQGFAIPSPPPGPPPNNALRPDGYGPSVPPIPGSAHMPYGAVNPDPARLVEENTQANEASAFGRVYDNPAATGAAAGLAAGAMAARRNESQSPSRYHSRQNSRARLQRPDRRNSNTSASVSQAENTGSGNPNSPPVSVKVKMHNDGRHVTLRRLNEEEAAAEHAARRQERRQRKRRGSSLSSGLEDDGPSRYRRNNAAIRPSSRQPITNVPPPPPMSSSALGSGSQRPPSEMNMPPPRVPQHQATPAGQGLSPPANLPAGSGLSNQIGSAGYGTEASQTESAFADNRKRRRAERARQQDAGQRAGNRVEFQ